MKFFRHTCIIKTKITFMVSILLLSIFPLSAIELPDDIVNERKAVQVAIMKNRGFLSEKNVTSEDLPEIALLRKPDGSLSRIKSDATIIDSPLGRFRFDVEGGTLYVLQAPDKPVSLLPEPKYQEKELVIDPESISGYDPPGIRFEDVSWWMPVHVTGTILALPGLLSIATGSEESLSIGYTFGGYLLGAGVGLLIYSTIDNVRMNSILEAKQYKEEILKTEKERIKTQAEQVYRQELARVRKENERRMKHNWSTAVKVIDTNTGKVDLIWFNDPRLINRLR